MSWSKNSFCMEYTVIEVIKSKKQKVTSIVKNLKGQYYISKKIDINDAYVYNQIDMMRTIKHPNIVAFHDLIAEKDFIYLIEQYCQQGDLAYHIRRQIRKKLCYFSEKVIAKWILQLLLALEYLHAKKIIHRDIRPQNIFLTSDGNLKLGCFRSSKQFHKENQLASTVISSSYYMAPQCLDNLGYDQKVDIWALGCLIYELCTLKPIFQQNNLIQQANLILSEDRKQLPSVYTKQLQQIFNKCLTKNSQQRQAIKYLLREQYFIEQIKKLINEKPSILRIPIKQYDVHFNLLAKKKKCVDIALLKKKCHIKIKQIQKQKQKNNIHLPKIQQINKDKNKKNYSKQFNKNKIQIFNKSDYKKQLIKDKSRQNSKQIIKRKSVKRFQTTQDQHTKKIQGNIKKTSLNQDKLKHEQQTTPKKLLSSPPLLPKPQKRKEKNDRQKQSPQKNTQKNAQNKTNLSQTMKQHHLSEQLSKIIKSQQKNQQQSKTSAQKILDDLGIKQQQQIQFSFQLQDQNMVRLTSQKNQGNQLIQTYKTKLQQLIDQINNKYCPNLQPIQQRTQQFDSNTFANLKK